MRKALALYLLSMGRGKRCQAGQSIVGAEVEPDTKVDASTIPYDDINEILSYLWQDEEKDYKCYLSEEGETGHIFENLKAVSDWLESIGH